MPTIDIFDGIKICIYNGEHRPPHFHAIYNEFEILIEINTNNIYMQEVCQQGNSKKFSIGLLEIQNGL
ncbi:MAG: DUF4160 domain-containing protein [Mangrovibacterium sp.]